MKEHSRAEQLDRLANLGRLCKPPHFRHEPDWIQKSVCTGESGDQQASRF
jgi:hypothetical protein